jgi:hypothetical protein
MKKRLSFIILITLATPLTITAAASPNKASEEECIKNMHQRIDQVLHAAETYKDKYNADIFIKDLNDAKNTPNRKDAWRILIKLQKKLYSPFKNVTPPLADLQSLSTFTISTGKMIDTRIGSQREILMLTPEDAIFYIITGSGESYGTLV